MEFTADNSGEREFMYENWCRVYGLDPLDTQSMIAYERACLESCDTQEEAEEWEAILG